MGRYVNMNLSVFQHPGSSDSFFDTQDQVATVSTLGISDNFFDDRDQVTAFRHMESSDNLLIYSKMLVTFRYLGSGDNPLIYSKTLLVISDNCVRLNRHNLSVLASLVFFFFSVMSFPDKHFFWA